ncbi:MAG: hypothetical protein Q9195_006759 [Heterodermia aff. obscurata]
MASFWLKAGKLALSFIPFGKLGSHHKKEVTQVQIGIGAGTGGSDVNAGGSVPHVALWDQDGHRIGQYKGSANGHYKAGTANDVIVKNNQNGNKKASPHYLSLVAFEHDGICVSMVAVSGNGVNWGWTGDLAKMCGNADWYPSSYILGDGTSTPSCIWIDSDHTNGIHGAGFSLHMPDFAATDGRRDQLSNNLDTNCKSAPRMTFWYDILPDDEIPFFNPPLNYTENGADKDPQKVITRQSDLYPSDPKLRKRSRHLIKRDSNLKPEHLVISDLPSHSAKEVCEDPNSLGWDFVSTVEGTYCDISAREWWYLCSDEMPTGCFDLERQEMRGNAPGHKGLQQRDILSGREFPVKSYQTSDHWVIPGQPRDGP